MTSVLYFQTGSGRSHHQNKTGHHQGVLLESELGAPVAPPAAGAI